MVLERIIYINREAGIVIAKINLIKKGEVPRNSPIPPHTPFNDLSLDDFINLFLANVSPPSKYNPVTIFYHIRLTKDQIHF